MTGYTDMHSHFVYGVDDGARSREIMEDMLDMAYDDGIRTIISTPHVFPGVRAFKQELYELHLQEAREYCALKQYSIELYPGAEIMYTPMLERFAMEGKIPTLAGSSSVLIEFMPNVTYDELEGAVDILERTGYLPIIAHMERYRCLARGRNAAILRDEHNIRYQVNASSIVDGKDIIFDRRIDKWLEDSLIDYVASDAHDCKRRPFRMEDAYQELIREYEEEYVDRLLGFWGTDELFPAPEVQASVRRPNPFD